MPQKLQTFGLFSQKGPWRDMPEQGGAHVAIDHWLCTSCLSAHTHTLNLDTELTHFHNTVNSKQTEKAKPDRNMHTPAILIQFQINEV